MVDGSDNMFFDCADGYAITIGDVAKRETLDAAQDKNLSGPLRKQL